MLVKTRYFGEIDLDEEKVITFENGLAGFEQYTKYTILYDSEKEVRPAISWLQSLEEKDLAFPVIDPITVKEDYNPIISEELIAPLGELNDENLVVLLVLTVPSDVKNVTANLKAPLIINADTKKGLQFVVENADYEIRYRVYDALAGEKKEDE